MPKPKKPTPRYLWKCPECSGRYRVKVGHFPNRCPKCQTYREAPVPDPPEWFKRRTAGGGRKFFLEQQRAAAVNDPGPQLAPPPSLMTDEEREEQRDLRLIRYYDRRSQRAGMWIPLAVLSAMIGAIAFFVAEKAELDYWQGLVCTWLGIGVLVFIFLPSLVAIIRGHHNSVPILIVNIFLFWTGVGWFVALVWSFTSQPTVQHHHHT